MNNSEKITKAMVLNAIRTLAENGTNDWGDVTADDVINYVDTTLAQMEKKNLKAKERAAAKKSEGDELQEIVLSLMTNEPQTREDIFNQIESDDTELTVSKIGARITKLVNAGLVDKVEIKVDKRKVMGYQLH